MSCCLSPKAYLNRFELLSLLRMKAFFPFKLQIDLILFSFIQDAEGVIAMKNQSDVFYTYNLLLLFAVCVPYRGEAIRTLTPYGTGIKILHVFPVSSHPYVVASLFPCPCYIVYYTHLKTIVKNYF